MAKSSTSGVYYETLMGYTKGKLKHIQVDRRFDTDSFQVRMVVEVDAPDELAVYKRLLSVLEVCTGETK